MVSQKIKDFIDEHDAKMREKWPDGEWVFASDQKHYANEYKEENDSEFIFYFTEIIDEGEYPYICVLPNNMESYDWRYIFKCDYQGPESKTVETDPLGYYWDDYDLATEADKHEEIAKALRDLEKAERGIDYHKNALKKSIEDLEKIESTLKKLGVI